MLQYSAVEPGTLAVLRKIMSIPELDSFYLVGGTALALYYGHRMSVDLDLFSTTDFNSEKIIPALENQFPDFTYSKPSDVGVFGFIGDIKVDFVRYHYHPMIGTPLKSDGIRLMNTDDIVAMKVAAILKRAVKKDFWDIAELLNHYSIAKIIECYTQKFPNQQLLISIPQAMCYFADAENSEEPVSLKGQSWEGVKKKIQGSIDNFLL